MIRSALLPALILASASCGGGSSPPPPPPPANQPPAFSSLGNVSVAENSSGAFYIAAAADPDGTPVTFSISGGADQALFRLDGATRELSFVTPPDFEAPTDANGDNTYEVIISASSGGQTTTLTLSVTVTDQSEGVSVRRLASGLSSPIFLTGLPDGSGRLAVVERSGVVRLMDADTGAVDATPMIDISASVGVDGEEGLLAIAFSPNFASDGLVYTHVNNLAGDTEIRSYKTFASETDRLDPSTVDVVLTIDQPDAFTNHNGGFLAFDTTGLLLIGMGDGGGGGDPSGNAQNNSTLLGKLLRIDVRTDAFPGDASRDYSIPAGNAFPTGAGGRPEIWANGLRNPFRGSVDPTTGDIFIGDVGQNAIEEVDRIAAGTVGLINFGWNQREGTQPYNGGADDPSFTNPVTEYTHGSGDRQGSSLTGGVVYRGPVSALSGEYVFADFVSNNIWSVPASSLTIGQTLPSSAFTVRTQDFVPDAGSINSIVAFGVDTAQDLYIVDIGGEIFKVEASN